MYNSKQSILQDARENNAVAIYISVDTISSDTTDSETLEDITILIDDFEEYVQDDKTLECGRILDIGGQYASMFITHYIEEELMHESFAKSICGDKSFRRYLFKDLEVADKVDNNFLEYHDTLDYNVDVKLTVKRSERDGLLELLMSHGYMG